MKTLEIKGVRRKEKGKKESGEIRRQGRVPCVLYGGKENIHFSADILDLRKMVYTSDVFLMKLDIEGEKYEAIMQDIQFHPVSDEILHIDFLQVFPDKKITVNLPIELTGSSVGIREGGKLRQRRRSVKVRGVIKDMPERFGIDITDLDIGTSLKIGDLNYAGLEILDPPRAMVVGVVSSRLVAKGLREAVVEEEEVEKEAVEEQAEAAEGEEASAAGEESPQES